MPCRLEIHPTSACPESCHSCAVVHALDQNSPCTVPMYGQDTKLVVLQALCRKWLVEERSAGGGDLHHHTPFHLRPRTPVFRRWRVFYHSSRYDVSTPPGECKLTAMANQGGKVRGGFKDCLHEEHEPWNRSYLLALLAIMVAHLGKVPWNYKDDWTFE